MSATKMTPAEVLAEAMEIAFSLGQTYWQQADSDSFKQKVKADATRWRFQELKQEALVAVAAIVAERDALRDALDHIGGLSRALRQGGPDPMDLEELSEALSEAVDTAHNALAALSGAGHER